MKLCCIFKATGMFEDSLCSLETRGLSQSRNHHGTQIRKIIQKRTLHSGPQAHINSSLNFIGLKSRGWTLKTEEDSICNFMTKSLTWRPSFDMEVNGMDPQAAPLFK